MKPTVFVHTNAHEIVAAMVAMYSHQIVSPNADKFDLKLIKQEDYPHLMKRHGQSCIRNRQEAAWYKDVPQSFLPLRFLVPQLMDYKGIAIVTDPDIIAVADIYDLFARDLGDKAILARPVYVENRLIGHNSSVMVLDCNRLAHWKWEEQIDAVFNRQRDLQDWIWLNTEPRDIIGNLEAEWNHYDYLNQKRKLLHCTNQTTQPWKTGILYRSENMNNQPKSWKGKLLRLKNRNFVSILGSLKRKLFSRSNRYYLQHCDPRQEQLFFCLLRKCLETNLISEDLLRSEIAQQHIRPDVFTVLESLDSDIESILCEIADLAVSH